MRLSFLTLIFLLFSCKKDRYCEGCDLENGFRTGVILYTGPVEGDGCDWVVKMDDDQYYHPDGLSTEFRQNELEVKICYEVLADKFRCGLAGTAMSVIRITRIERL